MDKVTLVGANFDPIAVMAMIVVGLMALALVYKISLLFFKKAEMVNAANQRLMAEKFMEDLVVKTPHLDLDAGEISFAMYIMAGNDHERYRVESELLVYPLEECTQLYFPENAVAQHMLASWYDLKDTVSSCHDELDTIGVPIEDEEGEEYGLTQRLNLLVTSADISDTEWTEETSPLLDLQERLGELEGKIDNYRSLLDEVSDRWDNSNTETKLDSLQEAIADLKQEFQEVVDTILEDDEDEDEDKALLAKLGNINREDLEVLWEEAGEDLPPVSPEQLWDSSPMKPFHANGKAWGNDQEEGERQESTDEDIRSETVKRGQEAEFPTKIVDRTFRIKFSQLDRIQEILGPYTDGETNLDKTVEMVLDDLELSIRDRDQHLRSVDAVLSTVLEEIEGEKPTTLDKAQIVVKRLNTIQEELQDQVTCFDCGLRERMQKVIDDYAEEDVEWAGSKTDERVRSLIEHYCEQATSLRDGIERVEGIFREERKLNSKLGSIIHRAKTELGLSGEGPWAESLREVIRAYQNKIVELESSIKVLEAKLIASETVREYHADRIQKEVGKNPISGYAQWQKELKKLLDAKINPPESKTSEPETKEEPEEDMAEEINKSVADALDLVYKEVKDHTSLASLEGRYSYVKKKKQEILDRIRRGDHRK